MSISVIEMQVPDMVAVVVSSDTLSVELSDGRTLSVPTGWFPRLAHATERERKNCVLIDQGRGIHWPDLDEDVSLEGLLAGKSSQEGQASLRRWLEHRSCPPNG